MNMKNVWQRVKKKQKGDLISKKSMNIRDLLSPQNLEQKKVKEVREKRLAESEKETERRLNKQKKYDHEKRAA